MERTSERRQVKSSSRENRHVCSFSVTSLPWSVSLSYSFAFILFLSLTEMHRCYVEVEKINSFSYQVFKQTNYCLSMHFNSLRNVCAHRDSNVSMWRRWMRFKKTEKCRRSTLSTTRFRFTFRCIFPRFLHALFALTSLLSPITKSSMRQCRTRTNSKRRKKKKTSTRQKIFVRASQNENKCEQHDLMDTFVCFAIFPCRHRLSMRIVDDCCWLQTNSI